MIGSSAAGRNILVTGGTGFVGSHLVKALSERRAHIIVPYRSIDPHSYFMTQGLDKKVVLAAGDVTDRRRIVDIVSKYEIDTIYHLAAQPIVDTAFNNPVETITTNVIGTTHILDAAWTSGTVRHIFITSSDKAYGKSSETYTEDHPLRGDHPYEASKSAADIIARSYVKTYNAPVVTVRFGNIYGPGDLNMSRIIPGIMQTALSGDILPLRSNGLFVRDYVYVGDVVSAYLFLLDNFSKANGEAYNIASDVSLTVLDLIKQAEKIMKTKIRYDIKNNQKNEIPYQHLDWGKIAKIGWKPEYSLESGILESYGWYKKNLEFGM
jgi:CDP-glucose 4,6-dehydratase